MKIKSVAPPAACAAASRAILKQTKAGGDWFDLYRVVVNAFRPYADQIRAKGYRYDFIAMYAIRAAYAAGLPGLPDPHNFMDVLPRPSPAPGPPPAPDASRKVTVAVLVRSEDGRLLVARSTGRNDFDVPTIPLDGECTLCGHVVAATADTGLAVMPRADRVGWPETSFPEAVTDDEYGLTLWYVVRCGDDGVTPAGRGPGKHDWQWMTPAAILDATYGGGVRYTIPAALLRRLAARA